MIVPKRYVFSVEQLGYLQVWIFFFEEEEKETTTPCRLPFNPTMKIDKGFLLVGYFVVWGSEGYRENDFNH